MSNLSASCSLIQTDTRPSLPLLLTSVVHLGHYRRREGGEREREETKRGREGERGLVFARLTHPYLPLYHSVLVLSMHKIILTYCQAKIKVALSFARGFIPTKMM